MRFFLIIIISITIFSCKTERKKVLPNITGKAGEVIIVVENNIWSSELGVYIDSVFKKPEIGLPQLETVLDLIRIPEKSFTDIFKFHRNIIFIKLNNNIDSNIFETKKNVWANNQLVVNIEASDFLQLSEIIKNSSEKIINSIINIEQDRILENYNLYIEKDLTKLVKNKFDIDLVIPKNYSIGIEASDFVWLSYETQQLSQGVFIYSYNYLDTNDLKKENLILKRNEFLKKYVAGPTKNSYMTTETNIGINYLQFNKNNKYFANIAGLWKLENDFMGGPFVSYSTLNKENNKIITVEGYVYAPKFKKRNYLRQVKAIAYSLTNSK